MYEHSYIHLTIILDEPAICYNAFMSSCTYTTERRRRKKKNSAKYLNTISIICLCTVYIFLRTLMLLCAVATPSRLCHTTRHQIACYQPLYATMCAWCPFIFLLTLDVFFFFFCYAFIWMEVMEAAAAATAGPLFCPDSARRMGRYA